MNVSIIRWALISALALPQFAHAQIYKWVDEKGVTSYGNKPPPNAARRMKAIVARRTIPHE